MENVLVRKQKMKDNVFEGYEIIEVGKTIAEAQLSKEKSQRHSHWKGVEYATDEDIALYGGGLKRQAKPASKEAKVSAPAAAPAPSPLEEGLADILKKETPKKEAPKKVSTKTEKK